VCEVVWFFSWVNIHPFDLKPIAFGLKFNGDSWVEFMEKTISGELFRKFCANQGNLLSKLVKFWPKFCNFIPGPYHTEKNSHKYFHMLFASDKEASRYRHHKKKIRGRKARPFCFRKTSLVHSRSGTYYALLLRYFGMKVLPNIRHCVYWVLAEIWARDSSLKIGNKFFIHHCQGWKEGSFACEAIWYFSWVNTHLFDLKPVAFCPKLSGDSWVEFQEKTIPGEFFKNFVQTKPISTRTCENPA